MTSTDADTLKDRLVELRADALAQLAEACPIIDGGLLRIVADCTTVLAVLDEAGA